MKNIRCKSFKQWISTHKKECVGASLVALLAVGTAGFALTQSHHQAQLNSAKTATSQLTKTSSSEKTTQLGEVGENIATTDDVSATQSGTSSKNTSSESSSSDGSGTSAGASTTSSEKSSATSGSTSSSSSSSNSQSASTTKASTAQGKKPGQNKRWVVDKPAWDETVVVKEAWDEPVYEKKRFYKMSDGKVFDNVEDVIAYRKKVMMSTGVMLSDSSFHKKVLVKTEHHPAQTKVVHHPEQGHWEQLIKRKLSTTNNQVIADKPRHLYLSTLNEKAYTESFKPKRKRADKQGSSYLVSGVSLAHIKQNKWLCRPKTNASSNACVYIHMSGTP